MPTCQRCKRTQTGYTDYKGQDVCWSCSLIKPCSSCGSEVDVKTDHDKKSLCYRCREAEDLAFDEDERSFIPRARTCMECGGQEEWCSCCQTYSCHGCSDYGTCQCN